MPYASRTIASAPWMVRHEPRLRELLTRPSLMKPESGFTLALPEGEKASLVATILQAARGAA
jgi:hypothetical protein